jgi:hypothetical protein
LSHFRFETECAERAEKWINSVPTKAREILAFKPRMMVLRSALTAFGLLAATPDPRG